MSNREDFNQGSYIRDVVLPIFSVSMAGQEIKVESFEGTAFLIGSRGFALTAGHVAKRLRIGSAAAGFVAPSGEWRAFSVDAIERHPTEDAALIRIGNNPTGQAWHSWIQPCARWEGASRDYGLWGYPEDIYHELVVDGVAEGRPDLIFSRGHIRRRMTHIPLPAIRGSNFFELSAIAGKGCSGSPVIAWPPAQSWEVIGIYCGERFSLSNPISVGYAVRLDSITDWIPKVLGHSIVDEPPSREFGPK